MQVEGRSDTADNHALNRIRHAVLFEWLLPLVPARAYVAIGCLPDQLDAISTIQIGHKHGHCASRTNIAGAFEDPIPDILFPAEPLLSGIERQKTGRPAAMGDIGAAIRAHA